MYLLRLSVGEFIERAPHLWRDLSERFRIVHRYSASDSEVGSWKESLPALSLVLTRTQPAVKDCQIYLEYGMPSSSCRADVLIAGLGENGYRAAVVIELKRWDAMAIVPCETNLKVGGVLHTHPSDQALGYRDYLEDLSDALAEIDKKTVRSCSYLHETLSTGVAFLTSHPFTRLVELSPLFAADQKDKMAHWISGIVCQKPDSAYISALDSDRVRISKGLFSTVSRAVREQPAWTLLDEQRTAYNEAWEIVAKNDGEKHLVLISGGPGTGKSVIALQLMGELCRRGISTVHVTNSKSFTTVMQSLVQQKRDGLWNSRAVNGLFRLSHSWIKRKDTFDVAICDEAHRFRLRTTLRPYLFSPRPQAEEILEHVRVMVAFIDEKQRLRKDEQGTLEYFRQCASNAGVTPANIHGPIELRTQFRYAGNGAFVEALDATLYKGIAKGFSHQQFIVKFQDSIDELEVDLKDAIKKGYSARLGLPDFVGLGQIPLVKGHLSKMSNWQTGHVHGIARPQLARTLRMNTRMPYGRIA